MGQPGRCSVDLSVLGLPPTMALTLAFSRPGLHSCDRLITQNVYEFIVFLKCQLDVVFVNVSDSSRAVLCHLCHLW